MNNKREVIIKKIEKYGFNVKFLNIAIAIAVAIFTITFFIVYSSKKAELDLKSQEYSLMIKNFEQQQLDTIFANVSPNNGVIDPTKQVEEPKFKNAKEAVLFAFEKFNSYTTYETESKGITTANAVGQNVEILIQSKNIKWEDGLVYEQSLQYETKTSFGQSKATEILYKNGKYTRSGNNLKNNNGTLSANFSGEYKKVKSELTERPFYIINNQTIEYGKSFSFVRDKDNKIMYYTAVVMLDTELAIKYYGTSVKEQGGTSFPKFSEIEISCNIDRDGNLISYSTHEKMTVVKKVVFDITTTTTNDITTIIKSYNESPSMDKPKIA